TRIIDNTSLYTLEALDNVFLKNNREAIWQLQPVSDNSASNTGEGRLFVLPRSGPDGNLYPVYLSDHLMSSFEPGDLRLDQWVDSVVTDGVTYNYAYKYKIGDVIAPTTEYPTILRLAEQYLIRAEARAAQGNIAGAQA